MTATHVWEILIDSYLRVIGERVPNTYELRSIARGNGLPVTLTLASFFGSTSSGV